MEQRYDAVSGVIRDGFTAAAESTQVEDSASTVVRLPPLEGWSEVPNLHQRAWEDWGSVDPLYAVLTDPKYRGNGGDINEFLASGEEFVSNVVAQCDGLGLAKSHERALDFGCGVGRLTAPLSARFETMIGLDISQNMVDRARELHRERSNCSFELHREADLRRFPDGYFDLVLSVLVLQHLPSEVAILRYLDEFVRVLRPKGALVVQLPSLVPPPTALPKANTRAGIRMRSGLLLRRLGGNPNLLYRRLGWVPEMTMTAVSEEQTRTTIENAGAKVVFATPPDVDAGGTKSRIYFATR